MLGIDYGQSPILVKEVKLESKKFKYAEEKFPYKVIDVELIEQISKSPCIKGETFGAADNKIWVNKGCRGYFLVKLEPPKELIKTPAFPVGKKPKILIKRPRTQQPYIPPMTFNMIPQQPIHPIQHIQPTIYTQTVKKENKIKEILPLISLGILGILLLKRGI